MAGSGGIQLSEIVAMVTGVAGMGSGVYAVWIGRRDRAEDKARAAELEANPLLLTITLEYVPLGAPRVADRISIQRVETAATLRVVNRSNAAVSILKPYAVFDDRAKLQFPSPETFPMLLVPGAALLLKKPTREMLHPGEEPFELAPMCELADGRLLEDEWHTVAHDG